MVQMSRQPEPTWPFAPLQPLSYDLIMIDPGWTFRTRSDKGVTPKGAAGQYRVMTLDQIKALPVGHLAARDCVLWLWATHPMLREAFDVLDAWGFAYATSGVWVKRTVHGKLAFGTGYRLRCASEPFLIATHGAPRTARNIRTVVEGPLREHSRKPDEAYDAASRMYPDALRRADVFTRERRAGWDAFGDQADLFNEQKTKESA